MEQNHDAPTAAHFAVRKTVERIRSNYWWHTLQADVAAYVRSCHICQSRKSPKRPDQGFLKPITSRHPFDLIISDVVGPLERTSKHNAFVVVFVDVFTRMVFTYAVKNNTAAALETCISDLTSKFGMCRRFCSDRGSNYTSEVFQSVLRQMGTSQILIPTATPHLVGLAEAHSKIIKTTLSHYVNPLGKDWDIYLPWVTFAYNTSFVTSIGTTPHFAMFGYKALVALDLNCVVPDADSLPQKLINQMRLHTKTRKTLRYQQALRKRIYDRHRALTNYEIGSKVLVFRKVPSPKCSRAFERPWSGPWTVVRKLSDLSYIVRIKKYGKFRLEHFHVRMMKPYFSRPK